MIAEPPGPLVIGYGNVLRSDDGFGWHVASLVAADPRAAGATVLQRHQLTPELALDLSAASFAIFIDAGHGPPGELSIEPVAATADATVTWSHHVDPAVLLALARNLYGRAPEAVAVSVGLASDAAGESLSPTIEGMLSEVVDRVVELAIEHGAVAGARTAASRALPPMVGTGAARGGADHA